MDDVLTEAPLLSKRSDDWDSSFPAMPWKDIGLEWWLGWGSRHVMCSTANAMVACKIFPWLAWSCLFAGSLGASSTQFRLFGDRLDVLRIDEVRGTEATRRAAYLQSLGLGRREWYLAFEEQARRLLAAPLEGLRDHDVTLDVLYGAVLADLLGEASATATLEGLVATVGDLRTPEGELYAEGLVYVCLIALADLGGSDGFLRARITGADDRIARLAILATGLRTDAWMVDAHRTVRDRAQKGPRVSEALETLRFFEHEAACYDMLGSLPERMAYVERRLARANPWITGVTAVADPHSAGHLVSRWAFERWGELSRAHPQEVFDFLRSIECCPGPGDSATYRSFLARNAGPPIARELEREAR